MTHQTEPRPRANGTDMLLWLVLLVAAFFNGAFSVIGLGLLAVPFGAVVLFCAAALVIRYFQRRS